MKIAYLVNCHTDASHLRRLALRLSEQGEGSAIFVHIDRKSPERSAIAEALRGIPRTRVHEDPVDVYWCGYSNVEATFRILDLALKTDAFDRFVILQGLDYPIKSAAEIESFFIRNRDVEFIRGCNCTQTDNRYLYSKSRYIQYFDRRTLPKRIWNRATRAFDLKLADGKALLGGRKVDMYWGCAHFSVTGDCARYLLSLRDDADYCRRFRSVFPAEEVFFHTAVFNSPFAERTVRGGPEPGFEGIRLRDMMNLTYFEYPDLVRVFSDDDLEMLLSREQLFARKFRTEVSDRVLDRLDERAGIALCTA